MSKIEHLSIVCPLYPDTSGTSDVKLELPILLRYGRIIAEFFLDSRTQPHIYWYTLTNQGSPEILHWGQEFSEHAAHQTARMVVHHLITRAEDDA